MKSSRIRLAIFALLGGVSLAHADILVLKNGTRHEGTIVSDTPEGVRMKYRLTPKIWDEKLFPRADVQEAIIQRPEEVEIVELRKLMPTPDLMTADKYEQMIQDRLRPFANKYKGTKEAKEIDEMIAKLQEEKSKVSAGGIKLDGQWLSPQDAKAEQFNIAAYESLAEIRAPAAEAKWSQAMRAYDAFLAKGPAYRGTRYYPDIVTEVVTVLDKWSAQLTKMATEQAILKKERDEGLKKLEGADLAKTKAAISQETDKWKAELLNARNTKQRWFDPNKYDLPSIQTMQKNVTTEKGKLQQIDLESTRVQNDALGAVLRKIAVKDYGGGANAYGQIVHLKTNLQYKDIVADLEKRLKDIYAELVTRQRSQAGSMVATPGAAAGAGGTTQDPRIASLLAETGVAPATAAAVPTTVPGTAAPVTVAPGTAAPVATAAPAVRAPTGAAPAPVMAPRPATAPAPTTVAAAPVVSSSTTIATEEEGSSMQMYLVIGAAALVLVLVIVFMGQKKRQPEA